LRTDQGYEEKLRLNSYLLNKSRLKGRCSSH